MKTTEEERKIIRNDLGIGFAVINALAMLICFIAGVYFLHLYNKGSSALFDPYMKIIGFDEEALDLNDSDDYKFVYFAVGCYLLSCLAYLYIFIRALVEPTFAAGWAKIDKIWPIIIAPILRIIYEFIIFWRLESDEYNDLFKIIGFSVAYFTAIISVYGIDDDKLPDPDGPFDMRNMKPWHYEKLFGLPK